MHLPCYNLDDIPLLCLHSAQALYSALPLAASDVKLAKQNSVLEAVDRLLLCDIYRDRHLHLAPMVDRRY